MFAALLIRNSLLRSSTLLTKIPVTTAIASLRHIGLEGNDGRSYAGGITMSEVHLKMSANMGLETGYVPIQKSRESLLKYQPKFEDLPARSMQDSYTTAIIPLSKDKELQDKYVSFMGGVRLGRLMEDMDLFAAWVCHQHLKIPNLPEGVPLPYTFVTILVDKISFTDVETKATEDIRLSGHVSWVGRSSIEVVVWLEKIVEGKYVKITRALFLMAARNATRTGPAPINPIAPASDEERKILSGGEERKKRRQTIQAESILKVEPNDYEQTLMYNLYKRTTNTDTMELNRRVLPGNCRWMSDMALSSTIASHPENRNAHNAVFGGFLLRNAVENCWVAAYMYCKTRPTVLHFCDISFQKPVHVDSFIKMNTYIVYTEQNHLQVMTVFDILNAATGSQETSNVFYATYSVPDRVPEILPRTYHETMWYIQGRRKFKYALDLDVF